VLARTFHVNCHIEDEWIDACFAYNAQRNQYYATAILERLCQGKPGNRFLGVSSLDLFVPILTFVFGEAQLPGKCAVVSYYRLSEPDRPDVLADRLAKEAIHELGHSYGLRHCEDWNCVMSSSHTVERLDVKSAQFCARCRQLVTSQLATER
jgi:archaemetzincin